MREEAQNSPDSDQKIKLIKDADKMLSHAESIPEPKSKREEVLDQLIQKVNEKETKPEIER